MSVELKTCPQSATLTDYLLGLLPPDESESCEAHLSNCQPCVETIQGLELKDTLHDLAANAIDKQQADANEDLAPGDSGVVGNLIHRMKGLNGANVTGFIASGNRRSSLNEDRAAEIVRLLDPLLPTDEPDHLGRLGDYRIEKILGAGSSGVVFQAVDESLDRLVAIKILRPSLGVAARDRFIAEAKATATLDHPNVIAIYQVGSAGESDSLAYIAMQLLPGETLDSRLARTNVLPVEQVRMLAQQIANGLAAAHAKGLIHRDIKPANLWIVDQSNQVKILDFGLVRITDEDPQLTCTGMIAGTPCYMSPEQSRGSDLDTRSDLFSLGCVAYQSLTGKLPFESSNALATLQSIQRDQPTPPAILDPEIPANISDLTMSLLEKSPLKRPLSAHDVASAFVSDRSEWSFATNHYSNLSNAHANPVGPPIKLRPSAQSGMSWGGLIATLLLTGFLGWGAFMFGPQIIRIVSNQGVIEINTNDPDVKVEIISEGEIVRIVDLKTQQSIDVKAGSYEVRPIGEANSIDVENGVVNLQRGGKSIVTVTKHDKVSGSGELLPELSIRLPETAIPPTGKNSARQQYRLARQNASLLESDLRAMNVQINETQLRLGSGHPDVLHLTRQRNFLANELKKLKVNAAEADRQIEHAANLQRDERKQAEISSLQQQLAAAESRNLANALALEIAQLEKQEYMQGEYADELKNLVAKREVAQQLLEDLQAQIEKGQRPRNSAISTRDYEVAIKQNDAKIDLLKNVTGKKRQLEFQAKINSLQASIASDEAFISAGKKKLDEVLPDGDVKAEIDLTKLTTVAPIEPKSTAVYDGLTLEACLQVIHSEHNPELLVKPIEGVIHLVAAEESDDLIEPVMKVFRRDTFDATLKFVTRNFLITRTTEQQRKILLDEIKTGTPASRNAIRHIVDDENSAMSLLPFQKEIVTAVIDKSKSDDVAESVWAAKFLYNIICNWELSTELFDLSADELLSQLDCKNLNFNYRYAIAILLAERKPAMPGLAKQFGTLIQESDPGTGQKIELLTSLRRMAIKTDIADAVPAVAGILATASKQNKKDAAVTHAIDFLFDLKPKSALPILDSIESEDAKKISEAIRDRIARGLVP
jgi:serine/threonine protein kinase